ncbi:MAG: dTMP kinase [Lachnospiraceae bacterium]|nr:dTMP kinase [Lachnospiraceae bacterium]
MENAAGRRGAFIAFEGIDGSGKGTQISLMMQRLEAEGYSAYRTAEPNDSPMGDLIHQIMIGRIKTTPDVIAALFVADRLDHLQNDTNGILKYIRSGVNVIADRYYFSSYAYQSVDLPMDWIIEANRPAAEILRPDVTVFLDVDPEISMGRIEKRNMTRELFERADRLKSTRERYFEAFEKLKDSERVMVVDGYREAEVIAEEIWERTKGLFAK